MAEQIYYFNDNVHEASLKRIRRIFDEFDNVVVGFSGGKDSTCTLNLALKVAHEKGRIPLAVMFVDQEAEWQATIDYVKTIMYREDVKPYWIQAPFKITNSTSANSDHLMAWGEGENWIREKDPIAIKENNYNTAKGTTHLDEFYSFFPKFFAHEFKGQKSAYLSGVRAEESPNRRMALTGSETYKGITWGKVLDAKQGHYTFYPLYDWSYTDIWKAIHENKWDYCKVYDLMYQHGYLVRDMRVSNLHHETAVKHLFFLQEIEIDTYNKLTQRLKGIATAGKLGESDFFVKDLPFMFSSWKEYRDFLVEKLITEEQRPVFVKRFKAMDDKYAEMENLKILHKTQVQSVVINDYGFVKLANWETNPAVNSWRRWKRGDKIDESLPNPYIKR